MMCGVHWTWMIKALAATADTGGDCDEAIQKVGTFVEGVCYVEALPCEPDCRTLEQLLVDVPNAEVTMCENATTVVAQETESTIHYAFDTSGAMVAMKSSCHLCAPYCCGDTRVATVSQSSEYGAWPECAPIAAVHTGEALADDSHERSCGCGCDTARQGRAWLLALLPATLLWRRARQQDAR